MDPVLPTYRPTMDLQTRRDRLTYETCSYEHPMAAQIFSIVSELIEDYNEEDKVRCMEQVLEKVKAMHQRGDEYLAMLALKAQKAQAYARPGTPSYHPRVERGIKDLLDPIDLGLTLSALKRRILELEPRPPEQRQGLFDWLRSSLVGCYERIKGYLSG